eukprot:CAMPEP_0115871642 /NCGR_PEP_ID=MMETSP0287-20121206/22992_1 /TAXON_ID=412157 /ORGANISM="Chrysochromulina rotalis, Strain UIO044" /LENGTH=55 /DNA_ID=CAMNT_0003326491 /DNA_START=192 /DNA_END=356 /DNA_ORIENTATION=-
MYHAPLCSTGFQAQMRPTYGVSASDMKKGDAAPLVARLGERDPMSGIARKLFSHE